MKKIIGDDSHGLGLGYILSWPCPSVIYFKHQTVLCETGATCHLGNTM
jgi:hypothetical protein